MVFHNHSEPETQKEAINNIMEYWRKPTQYEFNSEVIEIEGEWLRLKKSLFYVEGGGQPADQGIIIHENNNYSVIDVQNREKAIWLNVPKHNLSVGLNITAKIDVQRRETLSRNHSGQHLISAAFWEEIEFDTIRAEIGMFETQIDLDKSPTIEQINSAFDSAADQIISNLPIVSKYFDVDAIAKYRLRGKIDAKLEVYRVIEIGDFDKNLCGGTHVENTHEIGAIAISKVEGKKIRFVTGQDAFKLLNHRMIDILSISRLIGASIENTFSKVDELQTNKISLERNLNKQRAIIVKLKTKLADWIAIDNYELKVFEVQSADKKMILDAAGKLNENQVTCGIVSNGIFVLSSGSQNLISKIMTVLRENGIKGGGKGKTVMGRMGKISKKQLELLIISALEIN